LLLLLVVTGWSVSYGQNWYRNSEKYWWHKFQLANNTNMETDSNAANALTRYASIASLEQQIFSTLRGGQVVAMARKDGNDSETSIPVTQENGTYGDLRMDLLESILDKVEICQDGAQDVSLSRLDYMTMFNVFAAGKEDYLQWAFNPYHTERFNVDFPDIRDIGSYNHSLQLHYLDYLSAVNKINVNGHLSYRGAKVIDLLPGFEAVFGGYFEASIRDYSCKNEGEYHYALVTTSNNSPAMIPLMYNPVEEPLRGEEDVAGPDYVYHSKDRASGKLFDIELAYLSNRYPWLFANDFGPVIRTTQQQPAVVVYPNPNNGQFSVRYTDDGFDKIRVVTPAGVTVYEGAAVYPEQQINLPFALPAGIYILQVDGVGQSFRVLVTVLR
jgi:hypothetical protein